MALARKAGAYEPTSPCLGTHPGETFKKVHQVMCTRMLIETRYKILATAAWSSVGLDIPQVVRSCSGILASVKMTALERACPTKTKNSVALSRKPHSRGFISPCAHVGYCTEQGSCRTRPSSQKVLLNRAAPGPAEPKTQRCMGRFHLQMERKYDAIYVRNVKPTKRSPVLFEPVRESS